jgi:hypothetical protein
MKSARLLSFFTAAILMVGSAAAQGRGGRGGRGGGPPAPGPCDRACLEGFVDQYLDALVAHNPFGLPLASKVRFTENDQTLDLGDGLWNVTSDVGAYKLYVTDPQSQQVGFFGTLRENGRPVAIALRLKIDNRKISEIETLVFRGGGGPPPGGRGGRGGRGGPGGAAANGPPPPPPPPTGAAALEAMMPDPVFLETVPANERVSRDELIKAANSYFDAIEQGDGAVGAFDPDCNRVENGARVTNNPGRGGAGRGGAAPQIDTAAMGCAEQIGTKAFGNYRTVYPRRIPVVDEERQLVFGFFMEQQPGDLLSIESPGHGIYKFPDAATQPSFTEVAELFRIKGGKIRKMEALTLNLPYGTPDPYFKDDWRRPAR